jgi:hypothetical protein
LASHTPAAMANPNRRSNGLCPVESV